MVLGEDKMVAFFSRKLGKEVPLEHEENKFPIEKERLKDDKTLIKINKILSKLSEVENEKVDALRLVSMYIESSGRDINLAQLIGFLKK